MNEADTCRKFITPKLQSAGWDDEPYLLAEQRTFTNPKGRIRIVGGKIVRGEPKRADYLLGYRRDFPIAVVEAKAKYKSPNAGLSQAKEYAGILGLNFAYASNGAGIVEFDFTTGIERSIEDFPTPDYLSHIVITSWFQEQLLSATRGVGARRERVRPEMLLELELPFPGLREQQEAATVVSQLKAAKAISKKAAPRHEALTPSLLDRIFNP